MAHPHVETHCPAQYAAGASASGETLQRVSQAKCTLRWPPQAHGILTPVTQFAIAKTQTTCYRKYGFATNYANYANTRETKQLATKDTKSTKKCTDQRDATFLLLFVSFVPLWLNFVSFREISGELFRSHG
jgi:hypothetical protein